MLVNLMSAGPDIYHSERNALVGEAEQLTKEKQLISKSINGDLTHLNEAEKLMRFLARKTSITKYDDELFLEFVETIIVQERDTFIFNMKCGLNLTEKVMLK